MIAQEKEMQDLVNQDMKIGGAAHTVPRLDSQKRDKQGSKRDREGLNMDK